MTLEITIKAFVLNVHNANAKSLSYGCQVVVIRVEQQYCDGEGNSVVCATPVVLISHGDPFSDLDIGAAFKRGGCRLVTTFFELSDVKGGKIPTASCISMLPQGRVCPDVVDNYKDIHTRQMSE